MAYSIKMAKFADGERYSLLLGPDGLPDFFATLFATTQIRNASKAANTIKANLDAIRTLYAWAEENGFGLIDRLARRQFLSNQEIESLRQFVQKTRRPTGKVSGSSKVVRLAPRASRKESARSPAMVAPDPRISRDTQYIRLTYIAKFLEWVSQRLVERDAQRVDETIHEQIRRMHARVLSLRPPRPRGSTLNARRGLDEAAQKRLLALVVPGAPENPFQPKVQRRNELIIRLLLFLGIRQGELLALKVSDFDFQSSDVVIPRRSDDAEDPRTNQPKAKTLDRRIPMATDLIDRVHRYVMEDRHGVRPACRHSFLLVTHKKGPYFGSPLTSPGLQKVVATIKAAAGVDLYQLCPHVLRHTTNDNFSRLMDEQGVGEAQEQKMRSNMMGWEEGSGTAATYTRRHTEEKAREAMLKLQRRPARSGKDEE